MTPYFQAQEKQDALLREASEWVGTPFMAGGRQKGHGVDCMALIGEIYRATSVFSTFAPSHYPTRAMFGVIWPRFEAEIAQREALVQVWDKQSGSLYQPLIGDFMVFRLGGLHGGLMLDGSRFIHAKPKRGADLSSITDPTYQRMLFRVYRPC